MDVKSKPFNSSFLTFPPFPFPPRPRECLTRLFHRDEAGGDAATDLLRDLLTEAPVERLDAAFEA